MSRPSALAHSPEQLVDWHDAAGITLLEEGKGDEAVGEFRAALALAEAKQPDRVSDQVGKLATVLDRAGHYDEARTLGARAVDLETKELGPGHPDVAFALATLGAIDYDAGHYAESLADNQHALAIDEALAKPPIRPARSLRASATTSCRWASRSRPSAITAACSRCARRSRQLTRTSATS